MFSPLALLFSVSDTEVIYNACVSAHKILPASQLNGQHDLVFHKQYLNLCPAILRVYIGSALQLYGELENINLIKVHIHSGKVTLMAYEGFDDTPIPLLKERIKIKLKDQEIDFFDYVYEYRPQPLLMKSRLIAEDHPQFKSQVKFDNKLSELIGDELSETHISADRLDYLVKEHHIRIQGFNITKANNN